MLENGSKSDEFKTIMKSGFVKKKIIAIICILLGIIVLIYGISTIVKRSIAVKKYGEEFVNEFQNLQVGDYFKLGKYEQDNNTKNGKEEIEWLVLKKQGGKLLVISRYVLDCRQYNSTEEDVVWKDSTIREWLNGNFIDSAFYDIEKDLISTVNIKADKGYRGTNPGNDTKDKIFLLSYPEAEKYFKTYSESLYDNAGKVVNKEHQENVARRCEPTEYVKSKGIEIEKGYCNWWLRSPGENQKYATFIMHDGQRFDIGWRVSKKIGVRPAMWIKL